LNGAAFEIQRNVMLPTWLLYATAVLFIVLAGTALFFFTLTRGALILRTVAGQADSAAAHVYPIYSNMRLIRLVDWQPIIAAILLFQYDRLVSAITSGLRQTDLRGKKVLITSCAFGNVIPRVVQASTDAGASRVLVADIILNELQHARTKLPAFAGRVDYIEENATAMTLADGCSAFRRSRATWV
jgi:signal transduction histidine kinase